MKNISKGELLSFSESYGDTKKIPTLTEKETARS